MRAPAARQDKTFGEHLDDEPAPAGAKRAPDRQFPSGERRSREQQVRQVRAHDQHHHAHSGGEHPDRQPNPAVDLFGQRLDVSLNVLRRGLSRFSCSAMVRISACACVDGHARLRRPIIAMVLPHALVSALNGKGR